MNEKSKQALKRIVALVLAGFILVYIVYQTYLITHVSVDTEVATLTTINESVDTDTFVVRNESYIKNSDQGTLIALVDDGSRVAKGEGVAAVFSDDESASNYAELGNLKENIERYNRLNSQKGTFAVDVTAMNDNISSSIISLVEDVDNGNYSDMKTDIYDVRDKIITRQIATGELDGLDSKIQSLNQQYRNFSNKTAEHNTIVSRTSGYYINGTDGYETVVDYDEIDGLSVRDIEKIIDAKPSKVSDRVIGKVVGDFDWYMICVIDTNKAANLTEGNKVTVNLPYSAVNSVPAYVDRISNTNNDKKTAVVLRCNRMNSFIASLRKERAEIVINSYKGLKINNKAIRVNDEGVKGVFVKNGNVAEFKKLNIVYSGEDYVISSLEHDDDPYGKYVKTYDNVILGGKNLYDGKIIG